MGKAERAAKRLERLQRRDVWRDARLLLRAGHSIYSAAAVLGVPVELLRSESKAARRRARASLRARGWIAAPAIPTIDEELDRLVAR